MRRPVMYLAGLLLATGASLALAGPASAAPNGGPDFWGQQGYPGYYSSYSDLDYNLRYGNDSDERNSFNGIQILGNQGSGTQAGLIPILNSF